MDNHNKQSNIKIMPTYERASKFRRFLVRLNQRKHKIKLMLKKKSFVYTFDTILEILFSGLIINTACIAFSISFGIVGILSFGCMYWFYKEKVHNMLVQVISSLCLMKSK